MPICYPCLLPPSSFVESDFIALFEPAGKVQGPKFRDAIRSLRLAQLDPALATDGVIIKEGRSKKAFQEAEKQYASHLENPRTPFDVRKLSKQIINECVWPSGFNDETRWGKADESSYSYCMSLITRINSVLSSSSFNCIFDEKTIDENGNAIQAITDIISNFFMYDNRRLLRICMSDIPFEYKVREIVANAIGRHLLEMARQGRFRERPLFVVLDEAHHFLGRHIGTEDTVARLDAFELIAREGRKFGLNICFATQRPRDITEGVLSQIGTFVFRLAANISACSRMVRLGKR